MHDFLVEQLEKLLLRLVYGFIDDCFFDIVCNLFHIIAAQREQYHGQDMQLRILDTKEQLLSLAFGVPGDELIYGLYSFDSVFL